MFQMLNQLPDYDLSDYPRRKQYQQRQDLLHRNRLQELARLQHQQRMQQQLEQQQQQQKQAHFSRKSYPRTAAQRRSYQPQPWFTFPVPQPQSPYTSESDHSDNDVDMESEFIPLPRPQPSQKARTIPIVYANSPEDSSATLVDSDTSSIASSKCRPSSPLPDSDSMEIDESPVETSKKHAAAATIQTWFRSIQVPRRNLASLTQLSQTLHVEFSDPSDKSAWMDRLQALTKNLVVNPDTQKLALGVKENRGILELEERLTRLLLKADAVESCGNVKVREARRQLVKEINSLLGDVEDAKTRGIETAISMSM